MFEDKISLLDKVKECVDFESIVLDRYEPNNSTYKISSDMRDIINNTFGLLCQESNRTYNKLYDSFKYDKSKYREELVFGPVKYTVYNTDDYPKGFIHKIDAQGISYCMESNSKNIIVNGTYTNYYNNKYGSKVVDTVAISRYQIRYGNDGLIKNIIVDFRATEKERNSKNDLHDIGYKRLELTSIEELLQYKDNLNDYDYAIELLNNEHEKRI